MPRLCDAQLRHAQHYLKVFREASDLDLQGGEAVIRGLTLFDCEWPNIRAGQAWAETRAKKDDAAAALCNDFPREGVSLLSCRAVA